MTLVERVNISSGAKQQVSFPGDIDGVRVTSDGRVIVGMAEPGVAAWSGVTGQKLHPILSYPSDDVEDLPDDLALFSGGEKLAVEQDQTGPTRQNSFFRWAVYDLHTRRLIKQTHFTIPGRGSELTLSLSPAGSIVAGVCSAGTEGSGYACVWDTRTRLRPHYLDGKSIPHAVFREPLCFTSDGKWLMAGNVFMRGDRVTALSPEVLKPVEGSFCIGLTEQGGDVLAYLMPADMSSVELWNLNHRTKIATWPLPESVKTPATVSADGKLLAASMTDTTVTVWRLK